ncbi:hypothetical protein H920_07599 [Fukomys damarensis]|uniref:Uncharacterized protein n=1 Tax=Fukomys damarensis TaxID=885580 RepID=A0A091DL28_FUKDA|nr:hypothetical protein H920_07599 [Fukomys damarensis]
MEKAPQGQGRSHSRINYPGSKVAVASGESFSSTIFETLPGFQETKAPPGFCRSRIRTYCPALLAPQRVPQAFSRSPLIPPGQRHRPVSAAEPRKPGPGPVFQVVWPLKQRPGPRLRVESGGPDNSPRTKQTRTSAKPGTREKRKHTMIPQGKSGESSNTSDAVQGSRCQNSDDHRLRRRKSQD